MHLLACDPKDAAGLSGNPGKELGEIVGVQPIQRPPSTVISEHLRRNSPAQQLLDGLVGEELRYHIQLPIAKTSPIEHHRHRRRSHTHAVFDC